MAKNDPKMFLQIHKPPVFIDEVQYAPELFTYIKIHVDQNRRAGDFWLTGSQVFKLMDGIQESLGRGRVCLPAYGSHVTGGNLRCCHCTFCAGFGEQLSQRVKRAHAY